jgi:hypothetical protein
VLEVAMLVLREVSEAGKEMSTGMSNPDSLQRLADRFMNDADFREQMKQDPQGGPQ